MAYASPFSHWHCIDIKKTIDTNKPYVYNIGELPLITWFENGEPRTTLNICKHMGSKLDKGKINNGCLICPFHGIRHGKNDTFGKTIIFEDKLWWSYEPSRTKPPSTPFYNSKKFETIMFKIDMDANIRDCIFNTFDINHFAYVHNDIFGNVKPSTEYKFIKYNDEKLGISYTYGVNKNMDRFKKNFNVFKNYQIFNFPYTSSSLISLNDKEKIVVSVNMMPIGPNETRWIITLKHNFWKSYINRMKIELLLKYLLIQDKQQMAQQAKDSMLKQTIFHNKMLKNEEHFKELRRMFKNYHYPDMIEVMKLYNKHQCNA